MLQSIKAYITPGKPWVSNDAIVTVTDFDEHKKNHIVTACTATLLFAESVFLELSPQKND